jgi:hypothetical protein
MEGASDAVHRGEQVSLRRNRYAEALEQCADAVTPGGRHKPWEQIPRNRGDPGKAVIVDCVRRKACRRHVAEVEDSVAELTAQWQVGRRISRDPCSGDECAIRPHANRVTATGGELR